MSAVLLILFIFSSHIFCQQLKTLTFIIDDTRIVLYDDVTLEYYDQYNYRVKKGRLVYNTTIDGIMYRENRKVFFYESGKFAGGTLYLDVLFSGIRFSADEKVFFYEDGSLWSGTLKTNTSIGNIYYQGGETVTFRSNGMVSKATLATNFTTNDITFAKGTEITFFESGQFGSGYLQKDTRLNGYLLAKNSELIFYDSGIVGAGYLSKDSYHEGIKFEGGTKITFYEDGSVARAYLDEETVKYEFRLKKNSEVTFYNNGKLMTGILGTNNLIQNIRLTEGDPIEFYSSGAVKEFNLPEQDTFFNLPLEPGIITLHENGFIHSGVLAEPTPFRMHYYRPGEIEFYSNRVVTSAILMTNSEINDVWYVSNTIAFYLDRTVKMGTLLNDTVFDDVEVYAYTKVSFDESGYPILSELAKTRYRILAPEKTNVTIPVSISAIETNTAVGTNLAKTIEPPITNRVAEIEAIETNGSLIAMEAEQTNTGKPVVSSDQSGLNQTDSVQTNSDGERLMTDDTLLQLFERSQTDMEDILAEHSRENPVGDDTKDRITDMLKKDKSSGQSEGLSDEAENALLNLFSYRNHHLTDNS